MISVIIPTSGDHHSVARLCQSILRQTFNEDYEVLIVSNPPSQAMQNMVTNLPPLFKYFGSEVRGANTARNVGIKNSRGRYLFFLDSDCELASPEYFRTSIEFLDGHSEVIATGGPYRPLGRLQSVLSQAYYYIQCKWLYEGLTDGGWHRYLIGGNMQLRREVFEQYGNFDEKLRFGGTETEFFCRIAPAKILFFPERFVLHDYKIHLWEFVKKAFLQGVGRSYIAHLYGQLETSAIRYGEKAFLKDIGLASVPLSGVAWYTRAFKAGEKFYQEKGFTKPGNRSIFWSFFKTFKLQKQKSYQQIDQWLCITENFRRQLGPK